MEGFAKENCMGNEVQPFNVIIKEEQSLRGIIAKSPAFNSYDIEYSGGDKGKRKLHLDYNHKVIFSPYLLVFHNNTFPDKPNIKKEEIHKIRKYIQDNTRISMPIKKKDVYGNQTVVTSVDSTARLDFFELINTAADEFSDGGKDITPNEQMEIIDKFLEWYNKDLPWAPVQ